MTEEQKKQAACLRWEGFGYTAIAKRMELSRDMGSGGGGHE